MPATSAGDARGSASPVFSREAELSTVPEPQLPSCLKSGSMLQAGFAGKLRHGLSLGRPKGVVILSSLIFPQRFTASLHQQV